MEENQEPWEVIPLTLNSDDGILADYRDTLDDMVDGIASMFLLPKQFAELFPMAKSKKMRSDRLADIRLPGEDWRAFINGIREYPESPYTYRVFADFIQDLGYEARANQIRTRIDRECEKPKKPSKLTISRSRITRAESTGSTQMTFSNDIDGGVIETSVQAGDLFFTSDAPDEPGRITADNWLTGYCYFTTRYGLISDIYCQQQFWLRFGPWLCQWHPIVSANLIDLSVVPIAYTDFMEFRVNDTGNGATFHDLDRYLVPMEAGGNKRGISHLIYQELVKPPASEFYDGGGRSGYSFGFTSIQAANHAVAQAAVCWANSINRNL